MRLGIVGRRGSQQGLYWRFLKLWKKRSVWMRIMTVPDAFNSNPNRMVLQCVSALTKPSWSERERERERAGGRERERKRIALQLLSKATSFWL